MRLEDLKTWRKENGYTQDGLARALGVIRLTVIRWEGGKRQIPSFLHLALRCLELEGGDRRSRERKTEVKDYGNDLSQG
jgi:DNA-binding XRE family transcriptional regulator